MRHAREYWVLRGPLGALGRALYRFSVLHVSCYRSAVLVLALGGGCGRSAGMSETAAEEVVAPSESSPSGGLSAGSPSGGSPVGSSPSGGLSRGSSPSGGLSAGASSVGVSPRGAGSVDSGPADASPIAGSLPGSVAFAEAARMLGIKQPAAASAPLRIGSSEVYAKLFMTRAKLHLVLVRAQAAGLVPLRSIDVFAMEPTYGEGFAASRAEEPEELDAEGRPLPRRYLAGRIRSIEDLDGDGRMEATIQIRVSRMCCAIGEIETMQRVIVDLDTGDKEADLLLTTETVSYVVKGTMELRDRNGDGRDDLVYAEVFRDRIEGTSRRSSKVAIYDAELDRYVGDLPGWQVTDCCPDPESRGR